MKINNFIPYISIGYFVDAEFTEDESARLRHSSLGKNNALEILDSIGFDVFNANWASESGKVLAGVIQEAHPNDPFWDCILDLENCFKDPKHVALLSETKWSVAFNECALDPSELRRIATAITQEDADDKEALADIEKVQSIYSHVLNDRMKSCRPPKNSCNALHVAVNKNKLTKAITLLSFRAVEDLNRAFGLEAGTLESNDVTRNTCFDVPQTELATLHAALIEYWNGNNPSIEGFLTEWGSEVISDKVALARWQICAIKQSFGTSQDKQNFETAQTVAGGQKNLAIFFSSSSIGTKILSFVKDKTSYKALFDCIAQDSGCWSDAAQEIIDMHGLFDAFKSAGWYVKTLQESLKRLTFSESDNIRIDTSDEIFVAEAMRKLWFPDKFKRPLAECTESRNRKSDSCTRLHENVNKNCYTRALAIYHNEGGPFNVANLFGLDPNDLIENPKASKALSARVKNFSMIEIHNEIVTFMSPGNNRRDFSLNEYLDSLGEDPLFGSKTTLELETFKNEISAGNSYFALVVITRYVDAVGVSTANSFLSTDEMKDRIRDSKVPFAACFVSLNKCFSKEQRALLTRIGWKNALIVNTRTSIDVLREALEMIASDNLNKPSGREESRAEVIESLVWSPLILYPHRACHTGQRNACSDLRQNFDHGTWLVKAVALFKLSQFRKPPTPDWWPNIAETILGLPRGSLEVGSQRSEFFSKGYSIFEWRGYLAEFSATRYGQFKPMYMLDFLDFMIQPPDCGGGKDIVTKLIDAKDASENLTDKTASKKLHCSLNYSAEWKTQREKLINAMIDQDEIFGKILAFLEGLSEAARAALWLLPDARNKVTAPNSIEALAFVVQHAAKDAANYEDIRKLCIDAQECQTMLERLKN